MASVSGMGSRLTRLRACTVTGVSSQFGTRSRPGTASRTSPGHSLTALGNFHRLVDSVVDVVVPGATITLMSDVTCHPLLVFRQGRPMTDAVITAEHAERVTLRLRVPELDLTVEACASNPQDALRALRERCESELRPLFLCCQGSLRTATPVSDDEWTVQIQQPGQRAGTPVHLLDDADPDEIATVTDQDAFRKARATHDAAPITRRLTDRLRGQGIWAPWTSPWLDTSEHLHP